MCTIATEGPCTSKLPSNKFFQAKKSPSKHKSFKLVPQHEVALVVVGWPGVFTQYAEPGATKFAHSPLSSLTLFASSAMPESASVIPGTIMLLHTLRRSFYKQITIDSIHPHPMLVRSGNDHLSCSGLVVGVDMPVFWQRLIVCQWCFPDHRRYPRSIKNEGSGLDSLEQYTACVGGRKMLVCGHPYNLCLYVDAFVNDKSASLPMSTVSATQR